MNNKEIIKILKQSVKMLYKNDNYLIQHSVHEQDLSHRIAFYFENILKNYNWFIKNGYNIDVEYNRNFEDSKRVYCNCQNCSENFCYIKKKHFNINDYNSNCKPDIILHKRGKNNNTIKDKNNLIVIEMKKDKEKYKDDFSKLAAFTCENNDYKYALGIFININKNKVKYIFFKNGQEVDENAL